MAWELGECATKFSSNFYTCGLAHIKVRGRVTKASFSCNPPQSNSNSFSCRYSLSQPWDIWLVQYSQEVGEITEKRGAWDSPKLRRKWRCTAATRHMGEPEIQGKGIVELTMSDSTRTICRFRGDRIDKENQDIWTMECHFSQKKRGDNSNPWPCDIWSNHI